jgi:hypothetical protein
MAGLSKANLATLIGWLSHDLEQSTTTAEFTDAAVWDMAKDSGAMVGATTGDIAVATAVYTFPATARKLLAVIAVDRDLYLADSKQLEHYEMGWRAKTVASGTAAPHLAYTVDEISGRKFSIYPIPATGTTDGLVTIYTEARTTTIPEWIALPLAFDVMSREFAYPSDHQDKEFAKICGRVAALLYAILGL